MKKPNHGRATLVIRTPSGLSGDMLVAGLAAMLGPRDLDLDGLLADTGLPAMKGCATLRTERRSGIVGWKLRIRLQESFEHRSLADIERILAAGSLAPEALRLAVATFRLLGRVEGSVHGVDPSEVEFHEVGSLDSILDICLACSLFHRLGAPRLVCSPLPLCDGVASSAHGPLSTPTPAVLEMLPGVPVYGVASSGETVTPTALALLKTLDAEFGPWPSIRVLRSGRVFGDRTLPGIPNGALFAFGEASPAAWREGKVSTASRSRHGVRAEP